MSNIDDQDTPKMPRVEFKARPLGTWLKNLGGMEAFRYRAWLSSISAELDRACEEYIAQERSESALFDELLSRSAKPAESPAVVELVTVPAAQYRDEWQR